MIRIVKVLMVTHIPPVVFFCKPYYAIFKSEESGCENESPRKSDVHSHAKEASLAAAWELRRRDQSFSNYRELKQRKNE